MDEGCFKEGRLKAIVATGTLELGIDTGTVDEVVLIQAPHSVASATQRIGRAGHNAGDISRATLITTHARDLLEAITPIEQPLDALTQTILSMTVRAEWSIDQIFDVIRTSFPYCAIQRDLFDRVIAMLCGCYENTRIRELKPRLSIDNEEGRVTARRGVAQLLYANGGERDPTIGPVRV